MKNAKGLLMMAILGIAALGTAALAGCGGTNTPAATKTISTNATTNKGLLTNFTGANSVAVAGTWTNTTFGSTGAVTANAAFDSTTNIVTVIFDIDGNVYGGADPAPETFSLDMTDFINNGTGTLAFNSAIYGDVSATLTFYTDNTGTFSGTATNAPSASVTSASFSGTFEISGSAVSFTISTAQFDFNGVTINCTSSLTSTIN